jgi:hypothetical protein
LLGRIYLGLFVSRLTNQHYPNKLDTKPRELLE